MSGPQGGALEYDLSGNLTGLERRDEGSALVDALSFDYEAGPGSGASSRLTEVQDAAGALHAWDAASGSFAYDANGALVEAPAPYGLTGAAYDERGLPVRLDLAGGAAARYRYSLRGERTFKEVTGADGTPGEAEHYLLDAGAALGVVRGGQIAYWNVALPSGEVAGRHEADGARRYYLKDRLGSIRTVVDESGAAVETRDHYPFGLRMPGRGLTTGAPAKEGFTGHELDAETGLVYAGARYLMPALGRWISSDPLADDYPSYSPYNYALNNPLGLVDPDGQAPCCVYLGSFATPDRAEAARGIVRGFWDGAKNTVQGLVNAASDPVGTAKGIANAVANPIETTEAVVDAVGQRVSEVDSPGEAGELVGELGFELAGAKGLGSISKVRKAENLSELGDLLDSEVAQIQKVVNEAGRPLEVVGSAAQGSRRGVGTDLPIGKGSGTRSDIDYLVPASSRNHFRGMESGLPSIDPGTGLIPGTHNPFMGPAVRFQPNDSPVFVPEK